MTPSFIKTAGKKSKSKGPDANFLCNVTDFSVEKKTNKFDSSRTFYVVDKVNLDLRNVRFCSRGDSSQKGKQQNILTEKDLAVTVDPVVTACRVPFLSLVLSFSITPVNL